MVKHFGEFIPKLISIPEVLNLANLLSLEDANHAYQLSRIHPDTNDLHIFARSKAALINDPIFFILMCRMHNGLSVSLPFITGPNLICFQ